MMSGAGLNMSEYSYGIYLNGDWQPGLGPAFQTINPSQPKVVVGTYASASNDQIAELAASAKAAHRGWRAIPPLERIARFGKYITAIEEKSEQLAISITLEQGKPLAEARAEVAKALAEARVMAGAASHGLGEVFPSARPGIRNLVVRRPRGIIVAITPWNFPILTPMRKLAPALIHGNAIIVKPSEYTPATACLLAEAAKGILPDGLIQIANGAGAIGEMLARAEGIAGVTFTGSVATGRRIQAAAADNLAEVSLELGGKNAALINDTPNIPNCLDQVFGAAMMCAGQRCTAISRVIVRRDIADDVVEGLANRARTAVVGDGMAQATTIGPLTNKRQMERVAEMVEAGVKEGARVISGGRRAAPPGFEDGYFYEPTILSDVRPNMSVAQNEIFGPVISVLAYDTLDEAFEILNGVEYGLTSSLFSNDNAIIQRFIDQSENGMIHINHGTVPDNHMPFGGVKNSGVGAYSVGPSAANFYLSEHSVYLKSA
jgi:aldehyde dehydrogenase (NAD+)